MNYLTVTLPGIPPSQKNTWAIRKGGRGIFLSEKVRTFRIIMKEACQRRAIPIPRGTRLTIDLFISQNDFRRRDGSNILQTVEDALNYALPGFDDSMLDVWRVKRERNKKCSPYITVSISSI